jgi:hypothetical protein
MSQHRQFVQTVRCLIPSKFKGGELLLLRVEQSDSGSILVSEKRVLKIILKSQVRWCIKVEADLV